MRNDHPQGHRFRPRRVRQRLPISPARPCPLSLCRRSTRKNLQMLLFQEMLFFCVAACTGLHLKRNAVKKKIQCMHLDMHGSCGWRQCRTGLTPPSPSIPPLSALPSVQILGLTPGKTASLSSCTCPAFLGTFPFHCETDRHCVPTVNCVQTRFREQLVSWWVNDFLGGINLNLGLGLQVFADSALRYWFEYQCDMRYFIASYTLPALCWNIDSVPF